MNRTITIVTNEGGSQLIVGGYELDVGGLTFTAGTLRAMTAYVERQLIKLEFESTHRGLEQEETNGVNPGGVETANRVSE